MTIPDVTKLYVTNPKNASSSKNREAKDFESRFSKSSLPEERERVMAVRNALECSELSKVYKTRSGETINALDNFSLAVPEGQIFGFAGPNGAGKSTTIKILVGLLRPTSGRAEIFGHQAGTKEAKRLIGFLPEVTLYHDFLSAGELLAIHADLAGIPKKERESRCHEALKRVGLEERKKSRLKEFSKGMKQRFGIAQAIVGNPKLLILDELTSGLDPGAQTDLLNLLCTLRDQGLTIFFSSHHLREIERICDAVAIIDKGVLKTTGSMTEVLGADNTVKLTIKVLKGNAPDTDEVKWTAKGEGVFTTSTGAEQSLPILNTLEHDRIEVLSLESGRKTLEELFQEITSSPIKTKIDQAS